MSEVTQYPIDDEEYMTPQQAAEARRMKAELPLWQEMEAMPAHNGGWGTYSDWLADVELHRRMNDTIGQESEA
jgi:hypothetical protein